MVFSLKEHIQYLRVVEIDKDTGEEHPVWRGAAADEQREFGLREVLRLVDEHLVNYELAEPLRRICEERRESPVETLNEIGGVEERVVLRVLPVAIEPREHVRPVACSPFTHSTE